MPLNDFLALQPTENLPAEDADLKVGATIKIRRNAALYETS
jgi:hypothetical protein